MFFLKFWKGSGENPQITSAQDRGVSWRPPITPPRKLQHFRPARGRLGWLPRAMDGRGPSKGGHRIGRPSNVAPLLGCATEGSWWGCHHCLDQQQAVAAMIRYDPKEHHVSLIRAPFLLFSISSTPDGLCTSSVACPHLPPLLFFGASHGLHWQAAVQRRRSCIIFRYSTAFPPHALLETRYSQSAT